VFVEVSGILKAVASNLLKVAGDLRLMSSGPQAGLGEIRLPQRQAGSSIMPGKVNPVIPEAVSQAAMVVLGNDQAITIACSMGSLELNPFLPLVADALLGSLELLANSCAIFRKFCVAGIEADAAKCRSHVDSSTAAITALVEEIGYEKATELVEQAGRQGKTIRQVAVESGLVTGEQYDKWVAPERVMRLGSGPWPRHRE
jgi:aspartate ammonia-lyase